MNEKTKIQWRPIGEVHPYPNNPRNNDDAVEYVANSIREFGWQQPIVVDSDGTIIAGHTRLKAAKRLGMDTVPVVVADNLTPAQVNAYRLADNKVAEAATWDMEALAVELEGLEVDFDMTMFDFDASEFDFGGLGGEPTDIVEDELPEDAPSIVQKGDVWQLGRHRLMCGDSTDPESVAKLMNGNRADVCFTSPPYNLGRVKLGSSVPRRAMGAGNPYREYDDDLTDSQYEILLTDSLANALDNCDDAMFNIGILSGSKRGIIGMLNNFKNKFCDIIVWSKSKAMPMGLESQMGLVAHECELVFCFNGNGTRSFTHSQWGKGHGTNRIETENNTANEHTQNHAAFPVEFAAKVVREFTESSVLDLFGGTGTTLIAAEHLGRTCYMMELDPHYCDIIIERWQNLTGEAAVKVS